MTRPGYKRISTDTLERIAHLSGATIERDPATDECYLTTDSGRYYSDLNAEVASS